MAFAGFNVAEWYTATELENGALGGSLTLGSTEWTYDGKCYIFVKLGTGGVTGDGYVCTIDESFGAVMITTSNDAHGDQIGVAEGAGAENDYGWLQIYGPAGVRTEQDALANAKLAATSDAGQLDDAGAAGTLYVEGVTLRTATGGADAVNTTGFLRWPHVSTVPTVA